MFAIIISVKLKLVPSASFCYKRKSKKNLWNTSNNFLKKYCSGDVAVVCTISKIDAIYCHISKADATNPDRDFIASVLNDLENPNVVFNKPTTQGLDSYFIATHTDNKIRKTSNLNHKMTTFNLIQNPN